MLHLEDLFFNRLSAFQLEPIVALFLYHYDADFIQELHRKKNKKLSISFNFTFRNKDDVLSLNNSQFGDYVERIYPIELNIKDTADTVKSASYLWLHLEIDIEGWLKTKLYDNEMISASHLWFFHFYVAIFQQRLHTEYISPNWYDIPALVFRVFHDFIERWLLLTRKLLNQESKWWIGYHPFVNFTDAVTRRLTVME